MGSHTYSDYINRMITKPNQSFTDTTKINSFFGAWPIWVSVITYPNDNTINDHIKQVIQFTWQDSASHDVVVGRAVDHVVVLA